MSDLCIRTSAPASLFHFHPPYPLFIPFKQLPRPKSRTSQICNLLYKNHMGWLDFFFYFFPLNPDFYHVSNACLLKYVPVNFWTRGTKSWPGCPWTVCCGMQCRGTRGIQWSLYQQQDVIYWCFSKGCSGSIKVFIQHSGSAVSSERVPAFLSIINVL